ncbi:MAG: hypothetical protein E4G71_04510 [Candidatus Atribacteria bacterium]|nr:MAG: hypothetical protein E4G71_04510 [Candidatus Atribacteria bacterium]
MSISHQDLEEPAQPEKELLDPETQVKFVNPLPNPLDPSFIFKPTGVKGGFDYYEIGVFQFQQDLGLKNPETGETLLTTLWGYGKDAASATYPGKTFVVEENQKILVKWINNLVDSSGKLLQHLLPVDPTIHWALGGIKDWKNLGVPIVTHLHGGLTESASDGLPEQWFTPNFAIKGKDFVKDTYVYDNNQEAATLWYHDHALGITRLNVYAGLAGFYILRDNNENELINTNQIPSGAYEIPLLIQDRVFTKDGQLFFPTTTDDLPKEVPGLTVLPEFFDDFILVNGQVWPVLEVEPRLYRFRILNGSDSRFYHLWITPDNTKSMNTGPDFNQIGSDDGLLNSPVTLNELTIGPGERQDVIIDFSKFKRKTLIIRNDANSPYPDGDPADPDTNGQIMAFKVNKPLDSTVPVIKSIPKDLRPLSGVIKYLKDDPSYSASQMTRKLILFESVDEFGRIFPLLGTADKGKMLWSDPITEKPVLNNIEVWEIYNTTVDAHPIHLHAVSFQVISSQKFKAVKDKKSGALILVQLQEQPVPPLKNDQGWKDTVKILPGTVTKIIVKFTLPGLFVWHCHILSHEDNEMMRPFFVETP